MIWPLLEIVKMAAKLYGRDLAAEQSRYSAVKYLGTIVRQFSYAFSSEIARLLLRPPRLRIMLW